MRLTRVLPWVLALAACDDDGAGDALAAADASPPDAALPDAPPPDAMVVDRDGDGLDDAWEHEIAQAYLPFLSLDPADGCPLGGIVYRLRPHPLAPALLLVTYDHLYQDDCGLGGHVGDNEVFGVTVDPARPPPAGILAIRAIPHQGTLCERATGAGSAQRRAGPHGDRGAAVAPLSTAGGGGELTNGARTGFHATRWVYTIPAPCPSREGSDSPAAIPAGPPATQGGDAHESQQHPG